MAAQPDGAGEPLPTKHLYMFRWSPPDAPVPAHPPPADVDMRWLSVAEWERDPSLLPHPEAVPRERFAEDSRCLVMHRRDTGDLVYHVWVTRVGAWTDWIGGRVEPPEGHGLVFDLWAHPDWRRGRLHLPGAAAVARSPGELGLVGMVAGVEEHEIVPYARMYARAGLGFIVPYEVIVWHRDGREPLHDTRRPEAHLLESCAAIRRRYEEP
jgi:hypothetical protein